MSKKKSVQDLIDDASEILKDNDNLNSIRIEGTKTNIIISKSIIGKEPEKENFIITKKINL